MDAHPLLNRPREARWSPGVSRALLFGIGGLFVGGFLSILWLATGSGAQLSWNALAGNLPGLLLAGGILILGRQMSAGSSRPIYLSDMAKGCLVGFAGALGVALAVAALRDLEGEALPLVYTLTSAGAFAGTLVGYYRARYESARDEFVSIAGNLSEGIYRSRPGEGLVFANQAFASMFGYESPEDLLEADPASLYVDPERRERLRERARTEGSFEAEEIRLRRRDGSHFTGRLSATVEWNADGDVKYYDGALADISERKQIEEELRERGAHLRGLANSIPGVIYQFYARSDGDYGTYFVSDRADELLGISADSDDFYERFVERVPISHRRALLDSIEQAVEARVPWDFEIPFVKPSGEEVWLLGTSTPKERGEELVFNGVLLDITDRKQAERKLQKSRQRWQRLVENHQDGIQITVGDEIRYINPAGAEIWGADRPKELVGRSLQELFAEEGLWEGVFEDRFQTVQEAEATEPIEVQLPGLDGNTRIVESYSVPIEFEGEAAAQTVLRNVTEHREIESRLSEQRQKLKSLYAATRHILTADDPASVAERVHELLRATFDYPVNSVGFRNGEELVPQHFNIEEEQETPPARPHSVEEESLTARAYRSGETVEVEDLSRLDNPLKYGDLRSAAAVPIGDHGVLTVGRCHAGGFDPFDVQLMEILATHASVVLDRLEREESLREAKRDAEEAEELFETIFNYVPVLIEVLDPDGGFVRINDYFEQVLGWSPDEIEEHEAPRNVLYPDPEQRRDARRLIETAPDGWHEFSLQAASGDRVETLWTVAPLSGGRRLGIGLDVSEQKKRERELERAKEEAEEASRAKSAFLANMSHEIRTPLTSIIGFAEVLGGEIETFERGSGAADLQRLGRFVKLIEQGGRRLLETLDGVLNLSKLEAGQMSLAREPVDLGEKAEGVVEGLRQKADEAGLTLTVEAEEPPVRAAADDGGVQIITQNLVSNAVKYTGEGGRVAVRIYRDDGAAVLEVEDTGIGIDPDLAEDLFQPFRQASEGLSREYEGSGVGLAVTRKAAAEMGGTVDVESEEGEGSRFTVRLPLAPEAGSAGSGP